MPVEVPSHEPILRAWNSGRMSPADLARYPDDGGHVVSTKHRKIGQPRAPLTKVSSPKDRCKRRTSYRRTRYFSTRVVRHSPVFLKANDAYRRRIVRKWFTANAVQVELSKIHDESTISYVAALVKSFMCATRCRLISDEKSNFCCSLPVPRPNRWGT